MSNDDNLPIQMAVYMERLDAYIESQTVLNQTISERIEKVQDEIDDVRLWKSKLIGMKTGLVAVGILILHTSAIMASFVGIVRLSSD